MKAKLQLINSFMNDEVKRHRPAINIARKTTITIKEIYFGETFTETTIFIHEDKY